MASLADYGLAGEGRRLGGAGRRVIYIIGDVDTGKTTLAVTLAGLFVRKFRTAVVDLDAGQATVGPPTTLGWALWTRRGPGRARGFYFTGITSPAGHLAGWVAGAGMLVAEARCAAEKVVVDACGLARGAAGRALHHATVDVIRPDVVVAIERSRELAELLERFERAGRPEVIRATVPAGAKARSRAVRRSYRCARFREYFAGAREVELDLGEVGVLRPRADPVGRIASLRDASGRDIALAIVEKFDVRKGTMRVLSPVPGRAKIQAVVLGSMRIARDGRQLAWNV